MSPLLFFAKVFANLIDPFLSILALLVGFIIPDKKMFWWIGAIGMAILMETFSIFMSASYSWGEMLFPRFVATMLYIVLALLIRRKIGRP